MPSPRRPSVDHGPVDQPTVPVAVPPGAPDWITPELLAETIEIWQPYYRTTLTSADAAEILTNVTQLFIQLETDVP